MQNTYLYMDQVLDSLRHRDCHAHKGDFGKVLMLCGSLGYTGSAALAAMGALRVGAGLVYLGVPECIYMIEAVKLTEPIVMPLPDAQGMLSVDAVESVVEMMKDKDVVLIGPGLGKSAGTLAVVKAVLQRFNGPVILDADGINCLSAHKDVLRDRMSPTIMTPHEGEFVRFSGREIENRISDAAALACELGVILLLKGHHTVITDGKSHYINPTGNPGMAVGGNGDLLAGMIAGLIGQGIEPYLATAAGAYLHGAAGDLCAGELGQCAMLPSDMLDVLPRLLK